MTHRATLVALVAVALILTLVAPYGTADALRPLPRLAYWAAIVPATYGCGSLVATLLRRALAVGFPYVARLLVTGTAAGIAVAAVVMAVNAIGLGHVPPLAAIPGFVANVAGVAMVVTIGISVASRHFAAAGTAQTGQNPPAILDRLPLEKRGALLALSVEDHYVRVRTAKGTEMVLMRLADAMRETGDTAGAQVHRSHWVAFAAVRTARREGDRAILTLADGADIPVSRANLPKIRKAGLLPR